ncbi:MAG: DUF3800 domain-containing protein [Chloroflexi bacterium]|nr:DUF3800 domain-containing protein [Chloroflexota bacterium]MBI3733930.1 DUF3800 domain-containing protein [Chloroflexota bacterium]
MKYRLYVDEVGNSDLGASEDPNHRYLSLTGIIFELAYVDTTVFPAIEELKRKYFGSHPDEPIVLHRKELVNKKPPFDSLQDLKVEQAFNRDLLSLLNRLDYVVITTVMDKLEHQQRYRVWRFDPYHYCLTVLVERYLLWLKRKNSVGDVMAESRGGKEDRRLKDSFERVYSQGSDFIKPEEFIERLTSGQLKVKPKANNIAGLQLADLVAHPSFQATLARHIGRSLPTNFGGQIAEILEESKYNRSGQGEIEGWGRKWLP